MAFCGSCGQTSTPQLVLKQCCFSHILVLFVETSFGARSDIMSRTQSGL